MEGGLVLMPSTASLWSGVKGSEQGTRDQDSSIRVQGLRFRVSGEGNQG